MNAKEFEAKYGLFVNGDLSLMNTGLKELPAGLTCKGYLDLEGTKIEALPYDLVVCDDLDIRRTGIAELPRPLSIGHTLYACETPYAAKYGVKHCGNRCRTIYCWDKSGVGPVVQIGCKAYTYEEAVAAIKRAYTPERAEDYISKVKQAFELFERG